MKYQQVTSQERYSINAYRVLKVSISKIAFHLKRHKSTIYRELARNRQSNGTYQSEGATKRANARRRNSRKNSHFNSSHWEIVKKYLIEGWSPEQISHVLWERGILFMSHESIYKWIWKDKRQNGNLYLLLRQSSKMRRKRYRMYDSRGILHGKRHISERPKKANDRSEKGHFEVDLVHGKYGTQSCIITLVDRKTRFLAIGKIRNKKINEVNPKLLELIRSYKIKTITADNGTEFHGYKYLERLTGVKFYFATPHHSWERGTSENMNGLIRQYLPRSKPMTKVTQVNCNEISKKLNRRPKKILGFKTAEECYYDKTK